MNTTFSKLIFFVLLFPAFVFLSSCKKTDATSSTGEIATVLSVTSLTSPGAYTVGKEVLIQVQFSKPITVTGTPKLYLSTGPTTAVANYTSGNGTNRLIFSYIVGPGQKTEQLNYQGVSALTVQGGFIKGANGRNAKLDLPDLGDSNSLAASSEIIIDTIPPGSPSIQINSGNTHTNNPNVTLTLAAEEASEMLITNTELECTSANSESLLWDNFETSKSWTLSNANKVGDTATGSQHRIFAKYRDLLLNETTCVSATIIFNTVPPTAGSISINNDASFTSSSNVTVAVTADRATQMYLTNYPGCLTGGVWETYSTSARPWLLSQANAQATVYVKFRDQALNESTCISDSITHDNIPPQSPSLMINNNDPFTNLLNVILTPGAVGASEMYVTNSAACVSGGAWEPYSTSRSWTIAQMNSNAIVYIKYRDLAGNESSCVSDTITHKTLPPTCSITINSDASYTQSTQVTLGLTTNEGAQMYVTNVPGCGGGGSWEPFTQSRLWTLAQTNSTATVYFKCRDLAFNESSCSSDSITHDNQPPTSPVIEINNDDSYTRTTATTLSLSAVGATEMYVTNTPGCASGGSWESVLGTKPWNLAQNNSIASVYVKYRDAALNETSCISDSILHDNTPPTGLFSIQAGAQYTNSQVVTLNLTSGDAYEMLISNSPACNSGGTWVSFASTSMWNITQANTTASVSVKLRDLAGNESACLVDTIIHDDIPPEPVQILINNSDLYTNLTSVNLTIGANGSSQMYLTNVPTCDSGGSWESYSTAKSAWSLGQTNASATVYVKFRDLALNESLCISSSIIHDNIPPQNTSISINNGNTHTNSDSVNLFLTANGASQMYITNVSGCGTGGTWRNFATNLNWNLEQLNSTAVVYVKYKDLAGNESSCISDTIIHDNIAPENTTLTINSDATHTTSTVVSLTLSATGANDIYITNTPNCSSGGVWENYTTAKTWTLSQTNATATVFIKYRDLALNESTCISDAIIHDTIPPSITNVTSSLTNGYYSIGTQVPIQVEFSEPVTVTGSPQLALNTGATPTLVSYSSGSGTNTLTFVYTVQTGHTNSDLDYSNSSALLLNGGMIRDLATNAANLGLSNPGSANSLSFNKNITIDTAPPTSTSILILGNANYTNQVANALTLGAVGASEMYVTNLSGCTAGGAWETYGTNLNWDLAQTNSTATVFVKFKDLAGNESSCISDTIIHDSIAPDPVSISINSGASYTKVLNPFTVNLNLAASDTNPITQMYLTNSQGCNSGGIWETFTDTKQWNLAQNNTTARVYVKFRDSAQNESSCVSDDIIHDSNSPVVTGISSTTSNGIYTVGANLSIQVSFSEPVEVTGTPQLFLELGTIDSPALFVSGSGTDTLTFNYTVAPGDMNLDLDYTNTSALSLNNGAIGDFATNPALLTLIPPGNNFSLSSNKNINIDTEAPTLTSISILTGASHTNLSLVDLKLTATGASEMYVTNTAGCNSDGNWETYNSNRTAWPLSQLNSEATVYIKFRDQVGNVSNCISDTIIHDDIAPSSTTIAINSGANFTKTTQVNLNLSAVGASEMYVTNTPSCTDGGIWESYSTNKSWSLGQTNSTAVVYVKYRDLAQNVSSCISSSIIHDNIAPTAGTISINAGAIYSTNTSVTLNLSAVSATEMYVTNTAGCATDGIWEPYSTLKLWTLAQNNNTASVYVKYRDQATNESTCITDTIIHDDQAPTLTSILINSGVNYTNTSSTNLTLAATGASQMYVTNSLGCSAGGIWENYSTSKTWALGQTNATATVYVKFRDLALNESVCISDTIIHDDIAPTELTFNINNDSAYTNSALVTLYMGATGASEFYITNTPNCSSGGIWSVWEPFSTTRNWTLSQTNTTAHVYVKYRDAAQNESECLTDSIIHDNTSPEGEVVISGGATYTKSASVNLTITAFGATKMLVADSLNSCSNGTNWELFSANKDWTLAQTNGTASVFVKFQDLALNESACVSDTILHDSLGPTVSSVTSASPNGSYSIGSTLSIRVTFSEPVTVTGTPFIYLETGSVDAAAQYISGSGNQILTFSYTVSPGESSADLDYTGTTALSLNGGSIQDSATNDAILTLPAPGMVNSISSAKNIVIDTEAPTLTSLSIFNGATYTSLSMVDLNLSAVGATQMYVTNTPTCVSGGVWETYSATKTSWPLSQTNNTASVFVKFRDAALNESSCIGDTIIHDNTPPTGASVSINQGATYTTNTAVNLSIQSTSASQMYVTNTVDCASGGTWETVSSQKSWTLAQSNATATVYLKFRDEALNESTCVSDSIVHDNTAPTTTSITINNSAPTTNSAVVTLTLNANSASEMYVTNNSTCTSGGNWEAYGTEKAWNLAQTNSTATVYVKYRDLAGNESICTSDDILHDNIAPTAATISINNGSDYTSSTAVTLSLAATGASEMYVTDSDTCATGGAWESYATTKIWNLSQTNATATVYVKFRDISSNETSCLSDSIIHDNTAPSGVSLRVNDGDTYTNSTSVTLSLDATGADQFYLTNTPGCSADGTWEPYVTTKSWTLAQTNGLATVYIKYRDAAGNESYCVSDTILHDNQAPSSTSLTINGGASHTSSESVTLSLAANGASAMYLTNVADCSSGGAWENFATSKAWSLIQTNTNTTVYGKFRDLAGNESGCISDSIIHDNIAPTDTAISIESGATYTRNTSINLSLSASGASEMYVTNTLGCGTGGNWEAFSLSRIWTLEQLNSNAVVYVKFRDAAQNESNCINDSIIHDNTAPTGSVVINGGATYSTSDAVNLALVSDSAVKMFISNSESGCSAGTGWETFSASKAWTLDQYNSTATVYVKFQDLALNESTCFSDNILHDSTAPTVTNVTSSSVNGFYRTGAGLSIQVNFSEPVLVTGIPVLTLETGNIDAAAIYTSGSGTSTLSFSYTVNSGNNSNDLDYVGSDSLSANGGTVRDLATNSAILTLPLPGATNSLSNTKTLIIDTISPTSTTVSIFNGATYTNLALVDLNLSAIGASEMYVTNTDTCASGGTWEAYSTTKTAWPISQTNSIATVYVKFRDQALNESACISDTIIQDSTAPTGTGIVINNESVFTTTTSVGLALSASGASEIYVTNSADCSGGGTWEAYETTKAWTLAQTNSTARVFVKYRDLALNESACTSDSIVHDDTAPTSTAITINSGDSFTTLTSVSLSLSASGASEMYVTNTATCSSGGAWEAYTPSRNWTLAQTNSLASVYVKFKDLAGNESACISDTITHDNQAPAGLSISINNGAAFTSTVSVSLNISATGANEMYITGTPGCSGGGTWETYATTKAWNLSQTNTTATVFIKFRDSALNESSCVSDSIAHDNIAPTASLLSIDGGNTYSNASAPFTSSLTLTAVGASEMYVTNDASCSNGGSWENFSTTKSWNLGQVNGVATVYAKFRDEAQNESTCISDSIIHDTTPPSGTSITINLNSSFTISTAVNLALAATGASEMYVTNSVNCVDGGAWETYSAAKSWTIAQTNSTATVYVKFKDLAGNESGCVSDSITHDNIAPTSTSILIDNGNLITASQTVSLSFGATDAHQMYITNALGCSTGGTWETYSSSRSWTLAETNTTTTVYVKFRDIAGNESTCISDSIVHDNTPPSAEQIQINGGATYTSASSPYSVSLTLQATGASEMYITNTLDCVSGGTWETYSANNTWNLAQNNSTATVFVKFRDLAGNVSSCIFDTILHDNSAPTNFGISINDGATFATTLAVNLTLSATDATQMYVTNSAGCANGGAWEAYQPSKAWTLAQTNQSATVFVKFRDAAQNETSCTSDSITHDNTPPPDGLINVNNGNAYTSSSSVSLTLGASDAVQMYITNTSGCNSGGVWETFATSKTWILAQTNTTTNVYVKFKDTAENESACISDSIIHDNIAPSSLSLAINNGASYTNSSTPFTATLNITAAGASEMYITDNSACSSGGAWESFTTTKSWNLGQSNGLATVYIKFRDEALNESVCISDSITHDNTAPTTLSIKINDGSSYTVSDLVTLTLGATGASEMYLTNTASCNSGGSWEPYSAAKSWILSQLNNTATVYVKFRDLALNESSCLSDSIIHDNAPPSSGSVTINNGDAYTNSTTVNLTLSASGASQMYVTQNSSCSAGGVWEDMANSKVWNLLQSNELATVYVKFRDVAGNDSICYSDNITHDSLAPAAPSVVINSDDIYTNSASVSLNLSATGAKEMLVEESASACASGTNWEAFNPSKTITLTQTNTSATVFVKFRDSALNSTGCVSDSIIHDNTQASVISVTSSTPNGQYSIGSQISIQVLFSEIVTVVGTPLLNLATGAIQVPAQFVSGSGTSTLNFNYTVNSGDTSSDLDYVGISSLALNGGSIKDRAQNDVSRTLPVPGLTNSLSSNKNISIDTQAPTVASISINNGNAYTNLNLNNLSLYAEGASEMYVTNTASCNSGGVWEAYNTEKTGWPLSQSNTTTAVYVKFRDLALNETPCISDTIIHDNLAPSFTGISINNGSTYTNASTPYSVSLSLDATGASEMYVTNSSGCNSGGSWEPYEANKTWNLGQANSTATVYVKYRDLSTNESACISDTIIHDTTAPSDIALSINNGAAYATSDAVVLTLSSTGAQQMYVTNTASCSGGGAWETYSPSKNWTLGQTNSSAIVYVKFRDAALNETSCISDSIIHDNGAPTLTSVSINSGDGYTNSTSISLTLAATNADQMYVTNNASCSSGGSWEAYGTSKVWTLAQANTTGTVYVKFRDLAQNESACISDSIVHDNLAPESTSISINNGDLYTNASSPFTVTLDLSATGASDMYITNTAGCSTGGTWESYSTSRSWNLAQTNQAASVYVKFRDLASNESSCLSEMILHDNTAPTSLAIYINNDATSTTSQTVNLTLAATGASEMYVTNAAGCSSGGTWETYSTNKSWILSQSNTTANVYVKYRDLAANETSCISDSILHDSTPPPGGLIQINSDSAYTTSTQVNLTLAATDASQMYITNSSGCTAGGNWEAYATSKIWTLAQTNTNATVFVKFRDAALNESNCISDSIIHDNTNPVASNLVINEGAQDSNAASPYTVTLTLEATGASQMYITNTAGCSADGIWETYSTTKTWNLGQNNSLATVFVKFRDPALNESSCISDSILHDNTAPNSHSILINSAATYTAISTVNLTLTATGASQMYITNTAACASGGTWESYIASKNWILAQSNGTAVVYAKYRDASGNESSCVSDSIIHDSNAPTLSLISINDNNSHTNSSSVNLTLGATDATEMYVTNTAGCTSGGTWESLSTSKSWTLSQNNGTATVYVKFRDAALNEASCVSDSIIHDNVAPTLTSISIASGATYVTSNSVALNLSATGASQMYITNTANCTDNGTWENYNSSKNWTLGQANTTAIVYVKFRDLALNESSCISDSVIHDDQAPSGNSLSINSGASITNSTTVSLTLASTDAAEMYLTNSSSCNTDGTWEPYSPTKTWTIAQTNASAVVYVKFRDLALNETSCISDSITHDNTAPVAQELNINNSSTHTNSTAVNLSLSASGASEMYLTNTSSCLLGGTWEPYNTTKAWTLEQTNSTATVYVKFRDSASNESSCISDTIVHDSIAPTDLNLSINAQDLYTTSLSATLSIAATGANEMYVTNTVNCGSGGTWEAYNTTKAWTLGQSNGTATVYVKFRDLALNETSCISDSISHDNNPPSVVSVNSATSNGSYSIGAVISIQVNFTENVNVTGTPLLTLETGTVDATATYVSGTGTSTLNFNYTVMPGDSSSDLDYVSSNSLTANGGTIQDIALNNATLNLANPGTANSLGANKAIVIDTAPPSAPSILVLNDAAYTSQSFVDLNLSAAGATQMYVTNTAACASGGVWETYSTTKTSWPLAQNNTTAQVYVKFRDSALNESPCISDTIIHDNISPTAELLSINNGASETNVASPFTVSLTLSATGASEMYLTNASNCNTGGSWTTYSTSASWNLGQNNSTATVYVKFRDLALNESSCISDTIIHDNTAPADTTISINGGAVYSISNEVSLTLAATGSLEMYVTNTAACASGGTWEAYKTNKAWTLAQSNSTATVFVKFRDSVGNESSCISDTITHDNIAPSLNTLTISNGATYVNTTSINLTLSSTGASQMYVTNTAGCSSGGAWETYGTSKNWILAQNNSTATVFVRFRDLAGNESACISDSIIHDDTAPEAEFIVINDGASQTTSTAVNLGLSASGADEMYITNIANCGNGGTWQVFGTTASWTLAQSTGTAWVYVKFRDLAGNESGCLSDMISLLPPPPPDPTGVKALAPHSTAMNLTWVSSGGTTSKFQVAYQEGSTAPSTCNAGIVIGSQVIGASSAVAITGLTSGRDYSFRVCAVDSNGTLSAGVSAFGTTGWYQEAYLKASNSEGNDQFGRSISISGDTIVTGAPGEDSTQTTITNGLTTAGNGADFSGAAYVFKRNGSTWSQEAYLKASNSEVGDEFGRSTSISGDTIVVGALFESSSQTTITNGTTNVGNGASGSGAAYVFKRSNNLWTQQAYLKASNAEPSDMFGESISISGDTIVVGASYESSAQTTITNGTTSAGNGANFSGAAYVFRRNNNTWTQEAYLKASNTEPSDMFGGSTSISGDTIVVGASYESSTQTTITNGTTSAGNGASQSGAVYVFKRTGTTWAQEAYLKASNGEAGDLFGYSVSISGDTIAIGAFAESSPQTTITNGTTNVGNGANASGAVYVFKRNNNSWTQEAYLKASNSEEGDVFGYSTSISGDTIAVGAFAESSPQTTITNGTTNVGNGADASGATYVFKRTNNSWTQEAYLKASNGESYDNFGTSTSISGDTITVGTWYEASTQTTITNGITNAGNGADYAGAVYVFRRPEKISAPIITAVAATFGATAGSNIIISGSGFRKDATVTVGGANCTSVTVQGPNEIICTLPPSPSSDSLAVTVRNPNGDTYTLSSALSY